MTDAKSMFMECYSHILLLRQRNHKAQMGTPMHIHSIYQSDIVNSCFSKSIFIKTEGRVQPSSCNITALDNFRQSCRKDK